MLRTGPLHSSPPKRAGVPHRAREDPRPDIEQDLVVEGGGKGAVQPVRVGIRESPEDVAPPSPATPRTCRSLAARRLPPPPPSARGSRGRALRGTPGTLTSGNHIRQDLHRGGDRLGWSRGRQAVAVAADRRRGSSASGGRVAGSPPLAGARNNRLVRRCWRLPRANGPNPSGAEALPGGAGPGRAVVMAGPGGRGLGRP